MVADLAFETNKKPTTRNKRTNFGFILFILQSLPLDNFVQNVIEKVFFVNMQNQFYSLENKYYFELQRNFEYLKIYYWKIGFTI
jgi:negative regulator of genetic competence, sporulation and motility